MNAVLPGMRDPGPRHLAVRQRRQRRRAANPNVAGTSIAFAAESAYARMLHDALAPENIHAAQLIIPGAIGPDAEHSSPEVLARRLYDMHHQRDGFRHYAEPLPDAATGRAGTRNPACHPWGPGRRPVLVATCLRQ